MLYYPSYDRKCAGVCIRTYEYTPHFLDETEKKYRCGTYSVGSLFDTYSVGCTVNSTTLPHLLDEVPVAAVVHEPRHVAVGLGIHDHLLSRQVRRREAGCIPRGMYQQSTGQDRPGGQRGVCELKGRDKLGRINNSAVGRVVLCRACSSAPSPHPRRVCTTAWFFMPGRFEATTALWPMCDSNKYHSPACTTFAGHHN